MDYFEISVTASSDYEELDIGYGFNYLAITKDELKNGEGIRVVLWTAGCSHHCKDCQNAFSQNKNEGSYFDLAAEMELWEVLAPDYIQGVTLSGGDPLFANSRKGISFVIKRLKEHFPKKDIWLYTGYTLIHTAEGFLFTGAGEQFSFDALSDVDVLVDGPFDTEQRKNDLQNGYDPKWCGSSNQRVIDVKKSLHNQEITLYEKEKKTFSSDFDWNYLLNILNISRKEW